jgi:hypothetical protein
LPIAIAYCQLPIAIASLLPIAHCLLPIAHCLLPIAHCLLPLPIAYLPIALYCLKQHIRAELYSRNFEILNFFGTYIYHSIEDS